MTKCECVCGKKCVYIRESVHVSVRGVTVCVLECVCVCDDAGVTTEVTEIIDEVSQGSCPTTTQRDRQSTSRSLLNLEEKREFP